MFAIVFKGIQNGRKRNTKSPTSQTKEKENRIGKPMYFTQLCIIDTSVLKFLRREIFFQSIHYDQIGIFRVLSWGVACAQPPGGGEKKNPKKTEKAHHISCATAWHNCQHRFTISVNLQPTLTFNRFEDGPV